MYLRTMLIYRYAVISDADALPPLGEELEKHVEKFGETRRISSRSAWGLLYELLEESAVPYGRLIFGPNGKPYFEGDPCYFSISHSKELCAAAVSDRPVGVDIDYRRKKYNERMIARSLSEREKQDFDGDFARLWCRKESIAKLSGEGITGYPDKIDTLDPKFVFTEERIDFNGETYWLVVCEER